MTINQTDSISMKFYRKAKTLNEIMKTRTNKDIDGEDDEQDNAEEDEENEEEEYDSEEESSSSS